ncbi:MAG: ABC transporter permease [Bdellovibrionaceae bacterium]|nr:ABC transporter permease [Pseudobdellovibrionaceae bacterium]
MLLFQLAFKYTKSQLQRPSYWLAVLSFALAISLMVVSLLVISAYEKTFEKSITQLLGQIQISYLSPNISLPKVLSYLQKEKIKVAKVTSFIHQEALLVKNGKVKGVLLEGLPAFEKKASSFFLKKTLNNTAITNFSKDRYGAYVPVLLMKDMSLQLGDAFSAVVAKSMGKNDFNRKVLKFYVKGVLDFGRSDYNRRYLLTSFEALQKPLKLSKKKTSGARLWLADKVFSEELSFKIQKHFSSKLIAQHWRQWANNLLEATKSQKKMIFLVLLIILIIAAFNIMSALFILIVQKTKELSILRVAGLSVTSIYAIFSLQAVFTGLLSLTLGFALGYLWAYLFLLIQSRYFSVLSQIYKLNHLKIGLPLWDMLIIIAVVLFLVLLTAIIPVYRAGKNSLPEGLSHEL